MGGSILVVYTKPVAGREREFDEWYSGVHLPEVVRLDGFVAARRFRFVPEGSGGPGGEQAELPFLAIYEVERGMLDDARRALADALKASRVAVKEGRTPPLQLSGALHADRHVAWFEEVATTESGG